ncbi:MAG: ATP-dependent DNA helicase RecG [Sedimentisphaerales bacterium]|nr:ATP-dependent DNA helicase RecG [Sedimentisphaerales bacterium]
MNEHDPDLAMPVQYVKGVGPVRAQAFAELGVHTLEDLLEYFPRDWRFAPDLVKIADLQPDQTGTVIGVIQQTDFHRSRRTPMFKAMIADDTGVCYLVWFHGGYLRNELEPGQTIIVSGKVMLYKFLKQMTNPRFTILDEEDQANPERFGGAVYPGTAALPATQIRRIIRPILPDAARLMTEFYEEDFRRKNELIERNEAYRQIHDPLDENKLAQAKRRLKYDELFLMQLGLAIKRYHVRHNAVATAMEHNEKIDSRIRRRFPFLLTSDQDAVIGEIIADMAKSIPMNRLLQGDVGSGKTVVALYAALLAVANKTQAAIMAPTEILAGQHFESIERYLRGSRVRRERITGGITGKKRKELTERLRSGEIDIAVGTVALLQEDIDFADLGLVVIDEQHKFGVRQRSLIRKGKAPHCLVMTATPIPRTLAMTAFGDLDVSIIRHCPPGRGKVMTKWVQPHNRQAAFDFIRQRLKAGKQAYFVYPRIDADGENGDVKAAISEHKVLQENVFPAFSVGLLHGQIKSQEKERIMRQFRAGAIHVLVSTVVIEVGVDVPNATIMVIENANRFGLAQLHQLRGRIGRGQSNSYCLLFAETEDETAVGRLEIMTRSNDGFEIAEQDLRLRGPGELFSTRQHGLPDLKIASIVDDFELLGLARRDAFALVQQDPTLSQPEHQALRKALIKKFGGKLGLVDVA